MAVQQANTEKPRRRYQGANVPMRVIGKCALLRGRWRVEEWEHELAVGSLLPTLPLWLTDRLWVPLELEASYEDTGRGLAPFVAG